MLEYSGKFINDKEHEKSLLLIMYKERDQNCQQHLTTDSVGDLEIITSLLHLTFSRRLVKVASFHTKNLQGPRMGEGGSPCRMSNLKNGNVACLCR